MYQVNKNYNKLFRMRDFVYIRHIFKADDGLYAIDRSIENENFVENGAITRGHLQKISRIT